MFGTHEFAEVWIPAGVLVAFAMQNGSRLPFLASFEAPDSE